MTLHHYSLEQAVFQGVQASLPILIDVLGFSDTIAESLQKEIALPVVPTYWPWTWPVEAIGEIVEDFLAATATAIVRIAQPKQLLALMKMPM